MTLPAAGFKSRGPVRCEQQTKKSLKAQGPGERQGLSTPLASNSSSVVHHDKRCSTSSSVYCCVPFAGRSWLQNTMHHTDTTEQRDSAANRAVDTVNNQRMVSPVSPPWGGGRPGEPQDGGFIFSSGQPVNPKVQCTHRTERKERQSPHCQNKKALHFGVDHLTTLCESASCVAVTTGQPPYAKGCPGRPSAGQVTL